MMSPDNNKITTKDENHSATGRKTGSTRSQEPALKCPRCDSPNTKFCYYNNYNLSQPRHFCKTCRRYWTKGGALRNVPIGGGCRKNKKMKFNNSPRVSMDSKDYSIGSSSDIGGLKFFQGLAPAMDFQLGSINIPRIQSPNTGLLKQFPSFGQEMGFNFNPPIGFQEPGSSLNVHSNIASSIESLSSINQDLHWKLQQQRLATLFVGDSNGKDNNVLPSSDIGLPFLQKPQPILFQNLDINSKQIDNNSSKRDGENGNLSTEWIFDNSSNYGMVNPTPVTSGSNLNENTNSWPSGVQAWNDLTQYNAFP